MVLAVVMAGASAAGFAISTSLQHHAASRIPVRQSRPGQVLVHLARQPLWVLGVSISAVASGAHAIAVHTGALVVVQPIIVSGIVFAVPARAALNRRRPSWRDLTWVSVAAGGLALFIVIARPTEGPGNTSTVAAAWLVATGGAIVVTTARCSGRRPGSAKQQGLLLSVVAGVAFGLAAGLLKLTAASATEHLLGPVTYWPTWAMLALSCTGFALNQRSYQLAPLSMTMPLLNVVNVLVAVIFGWYVFDERPAHDPGSLLAEAAALALVCVGVHQLARQEQPTTPVDAGRPVRT